MIFWWTPNKLFKDYVLNNAHKWSHHGCYDKNILQHDFMEISSLFWATKMWLLRNSAVMLQLNNIITLVMTPIALCCTCQCPSANMDCLAPAIKVDPHAKNQGRRSNDSNRRVYTDTETNGRTDATKCIIKLFMQESPDKQMDGRYQAYYLPATWSIMMMLS